MPSPSRTSEVTPKAAPLAASISTSTRSSAPASKRSAGEDGTEMTPHKLLGQPQDDHLEVVAQPAGEGKRGSAHAFGDLLS